jgi:hypothetical protein
VACLVPGRDDVITGPARLVDAGGGVFLIVDFGRASSGYPASLVLLECAGRHRDPAGLTAIRVRGASAVRFGDAAPASTSCSSEYVHFATNAHELNNPDGGRRLGGAGLQERTPQSLEALLAATQRAAQAYGGNSSDARLSRPPGVFAVRGSLPPGYRLRRAG